MRMEIYETAPTTYNLPPDHRDFGIGILCALPLEATAVIALFDERWDESKLEKEPYDRNTYSIGLIGSHNVVLVHMPRMGKVPSASVAAHLNRSFPNLTLVLMVGICGGVPLNSGDQRLLGDVVISEGIVQYDMGKQLDHQYVKILPVQQPGFEISAVLKKLQTRQEKILLQDNTFRNLQDLQRKPELQGSAEYPGQEWDKVFRADYLHRHRGDSVCGECSEDRGCDESVKLACDKVGCSEEGLVMTPRARNSHRPLVHFGLIASGDTVVKSGKFRDRIVKESDVIAFEMEGAGMCMEFSNFLVIKSICDYADGHKNKTFQAYAATTAAAATKALLRQWTPYKLFRPDVVVESSRTMSPTLSVEDYKLLSLLEMTPYRDRKDRNPDRITGTCEWFLKHPIFCDWRNHASRALWVSADPGCGKSVLAKFLIDHVFPTNPARTTCYFFFKDDFEDQRSAVGALSCILHQLFKQKPISFSEEVRAQLQTDPQKLTTSFRNLWYALIEAAARVSRAEILCILDALDECEDSSRSLFTQELQSLHRSGKHPNLRFLFTSRPFGKIHRGFQLPDSAGLSVVHLGGENDKEAAQIAKEIDIYIKARVPSVCASLRLRQHEQDFMLKELLRVEHRTYLWVFLVIQHIENDINIDQDGIMKALSELPKSVDEAYERILSLSSNVQEARRILQIIVAAKRPLTIQEMNFAMSIRVHHKSYAEFELDNEERFQERLRDACGLFILVVDKKIYLLHQTAREFLVRIGTQGLPETQRQSRKSFLLPLVDTQKWSLKSPGKNWSWKHTIDLGESNHILANICLWHLCFDEVNTDTGLGHTAEDAKPQADDHLFLTYSATHFAHHVRSSMKQANKDKQLIELLVSICQYMEYYCPVWYRVHSPAVEPQRNALIFASKLGLTPAVKLLIKEYKYDIDAQDATGWSALTWAVAKGFSDVSRILIRGRGLDRLWFAFQKKQVDIDQTVLIKACKNAWSVEIVSLLLKHGADIDARDEYGHTPLTAAVRSDQAETVKLLYDLYPDIFTRPTPHKPLRLAILNGNGAMVQLLLERGVSVDEIHEDGHTPLTIAVDVGQTGIVKLLCERHPGLVSLPTEYPALLLACNNRNKAMIQLLMHNGANPDIKDMEGTPLLTTAVSNHDYGCVKNLIDLKADVNYRDSNGYTPLAICATISRRGKECLGIMQLLLARRSDANAQDNNGMSVLSLYCASVTSKDTEFGFVELLLKYGAALENKCPKGRTPLSYATHDFGSPAVVEELLKKGADPNSVDNNGRSVLSWAASSAGPEVIRLLLENSALVASKDHGGRSVLSWACGTWPGDLGRVILLLKNGADVNTKDNDGRSLLYWSIDYRNFSVAEYLIRSLGADVNSKAHNGQSVLSRACENGHIDFVGLLLEHGARVGGTDNVGRSALWWACERGATEIEKLLMDRGATKEQLEGTLRRVPLTTEASRGHDFN